MKLSFLSLSVLSAAALCGGCAHTGHPADSSPRVVCKDGTPYTGNGECGGRGGIDRHATNEKSSRLRDAQVSGAGAAGHPGEVWATPATKTYVCPGDRDYGVSKEGQYIGEAEAKAKGWRPAGGQPCPS
jgi:hypothetical protein